MEKLKHLYFEGALSVGETLQLDKDVAKRLSRVLRYKTGDKAAFFNGKDGLFEAEMLDEKCQQILVKSCLKPMPENAAKVVLMVAMVKKEAMDKIFRSATEFGVTDIIPLTTEFTVVDKTNEDRINTMLIEASEQCERLSVPTLHPLSRLEKTVEAFEGEIFWCAEQVGGKWGKVNPKSGDALLVGPEGGFSPMERKWLSAKANVKPVGLGPFILRADTAVCAGLSRFFDHLEQE